jgi:carbon starvation protein
MSQHFSAIAAAGPIVGPIAACLAFGWLPCILWILVGVVFIGSVHDFSALVASIRHGGNSIAEIAKRNLGRRAWLALVAFIWIALVYVIVAFTAVTADTFAGLAEDVAHLDVAFDKGGAVAAASTMYLALALVMGLVQRFFRPPIWLVTVIFVPATLGVVWLGTQMDSVLSLPASAWYVALLVYCFVASMLPLWLLQQPRGYLGGFVLYMALGVGVLGIFCGGFEIRQPMLKSVSLFSPGAGPANAMFPFLFVTIACGACSGFHGLICGGTTSKQVSRESHCKPIAFGSMLLEGFVAVIALATVMIVAEGETAGRAPAQIYGDGLARFFTVLVPEGNRDAVFLFAATFGAMAFSTFVFDTLDVSTRLGRYLLQELFATPSRLAGALAGGATAFVPLALLLSSDAGSWRTFWTLFGTANQLLAALTLLGISVWLRRTGRRCWYTALPMAFVMVVTLTALGDQAWSGFRAAFGGPGVAVAPLANAIVSLALMALAGIFIYEGVSAVKNGPGPIIGGRESAAGGTIRGR